MGEGVTGSGRADPPARTAVRRALDTAGLGGRRKRAVHLALDPAGPALSPVAGSGRATLRHTPATAYGCSLPGLTGFTARSRAGLDHRHCLPGAARSS